MTPTRVDDLPVGGRVWFSEEKRPYTVQARSRRFLVCTKAFAARRTVLYTVVDLKERIRGTENLVFGMGAETREDCEAMIDRLEGRDRSIGFTTEVSHRNFVPLVVERVEHAKVRA
jgi:hypothetical protein